MEERAQKLHIYIINWSLTKEKRQCSKDCLFNNNDEWAESYKTCLPLFFLNIHYICPTICFSFYFSQFPVLTATQSYTKHKQHIHSTDMIYYLPTEDKCLYQMKNMAISFYLSIYSSLREIITILSPRVNSSQPKSNTVLIFLLSLVHLGMGM